MALEHIIHQLTDSSFVEIDGEGDASFGRAHIALWIGREEIDGIEKAIAGEGIAREIDGLALCNVIRQHLERFHHNKSCNDRVGCGDGRYDVASHS